MIRDAIYDLIARNRYHWFGRRDACILPTKQAALLQFNSVPDAGEQLKTLGHDDHPNVGNLIGYSYRKPGDYKFSQVWYERALKADPNHVLSGGITACGKLSRATGIKRTKMQEGRASLPGLSFS